jgi:hypothetical protein
MLKWLHHLLDPHCPHCRDEALENKVCESCETLKMQLAIVNAEKQQMLNALLEKPEPVPEVRQQVDRELLKPKLMTWNIRKQMLEAEDRES